MTRTTVPDLFFADAPCRCVRLFKFRNKNQYLQQGSYPNICEGRSSLQKKDDMDIQDRTQQAHHACGLSEPWRLPANWGATP